MWKSSALASYQTARVNLNFALGSADAFRLRTVTMKTIEPKKEE